MKDKCEKTNLAYQDAKTDTGGSYSEAKLAAIQLPPLAGKRFLDLGCNAGYYCGKAHEHGATRVLGVLPIIRFRMKDPASAVEAQRGAAGRFAEGGAEAARSRHLYALENSHVRLADQPDSGYARRAGRFPRRMKPVFRSAAALVPFEFHQDLAIQSYPATTRDHEIND